MKSNLFSEFNGVSYSEWLEKITSDLKGKPLDVLTTKPEPDLEIVAYHHGQNLNPVDENSYLRRVGKATNDWEIRQVFSGDRAQNERILNALNDGITSVGLEINSDTNFDHLTRNIHFEHISSDLKFTKPESVSDFTPPQNSHLNFDVLATNLKVGEMEYQLDGYYSFYTAYPKHKNIWVSGNLYGESGASTVQELGLTIAHLNEYIQYLRNKGESLEHINQKIVVELSINENYFVNIAKFRVFRSLVALLFKGHDADYLPTTPVIYATTSSRHMAQNDANNNPLRETTQAMSAVIGGCDILTVNHSTFGTAQENKRFERIAKNIQLILKEESYLNYVTDPAGGSYYLESLSNQLLQKSWALFLEIEQEGGLIESAAHNKIQERIAKNKTALINDLETNARTFLGVNKHPNSMENWKEISQESPASKTAFKALLPFQLEHYFSKTTANHE